MDLLSLSENTAKKKKKKLACVEDFKTQKMTTEVIFLEADLT